MSNSCTVEVRNFDDDVLVLVEDNYGKTFLSYEPSEFKQMFPNVVDLLRVIADECDEMDGAFYVEPDTDEIVLDTVSSLEVWGFNGDPSEVNLSLLRNY